MGRAFSASAFSYQQLAGNRTYKNTDPWTPRAPRCRRGGSLPERQRRLGHQGILRSKQRAPGVGATFKQGLTKPVAGRKVSVVFWTRTS